MVAMEKPAKNQVSVSNRTYWRTGIYWNKNKIPVAY